MIFYAGKISGIIMLKHYWKEQQLRLTKQIQLNRLNATAK